MDASGSMQSCYDTTLAALNGQIASLRSVQEEHPDQDVRFSISDFSDDYRMWFAPKSIGEIHDISEEQYQLRGSTALWDGLDGHPGAAARRPRTAALGTHRPGGPGLAGGAGGSAGGATAANGASGYIEITVW